MSSDEKFWLTIAVSIILAIVLIVMGTQKYEDNKNQLKVDMVRAGATPAEASCSLDGSFNACMLAASEKK